MRAQPEPYDAAAAARDLAWLREVGAVRGIDPDADAGTFVVELPDRRLLELDVAAVPAFRAGVLTGWRLPRSEVLG